jgi:hypothetical protein
VSPRESLHQDPNTSVILGEAPDGLPLILSVERPATVRGSILASLGYPEWDELPADIAAAISSLEGAVAQTARKLGLVQLDGGMLYKSSRTMGDLFGDTMLARAIGAQSPMILAEDRYTESAQPDHVANTAAFALQSPQRPITVMKHLHKDRYLAMPTRSGPVFAAEIGADEVLEPESLQPLIYEDLRRLPSARFHYEVSYVPHSGALADEAEYTAAVRQAQRLAWSVGVHDLALVTAQVADSVQAFHDENRVHCDVKPGNTLITADGAVAIDALGVAVGSVSPGATPGWAAPELILARPVTPATDVFALGLIVARLVEAAIFGEERSFVIPTGRDSRRRVRLLGDADVFIDPDGVEMSDALRADYTDFIRRCVAFEPAHRPVDAAAFAAELRALLEREQLPGQLPLSGGPGALHRNVELLGASRSGWVVRDQCNFSLKKVGPSIR